MEEITYQCGISDQYTDEAILLYEQAFGKKISFAINDESETKKILRQSLVPKYAIYALFEQHIIGIADLYSHAGSFTGGIGYKELISQSLETR